MEKKEIKRTQTRIHTRALDRNVAKNIMKKKGYPMHKIFKNGFFARNWRVFANEIYIK